MKSSVLRILKCDSGGGLVVGAGVLVLHTWLAELTGLAPQVVLFMGVMNVGYGCYSGALLLRAIKTGRAPRRSADILIVANFIWVLVCAGIAARSWAALTWIGIGNLALEMTIVGGLAVVEVKFLRRGR